MAGRTRLGYGRLAFFAAHWNVILPNRKHTLK